MASSISAGIAISDMLKASQEVKEMVTDIYSVVAEEKATLPYIVYRRVSLDQQAVKSPLYCDQATIEVLCYAASYPDSVELAELAREALDGQRWTGDGLTVRSCRLADSDEGWMDDAYFQRLIFNIKI